MAKRKIPMKSFFKTKRILIRTYREKDIFPISGKGYVVEKVVMPTMNRGSQSTILKRTKTKAEADKYYLKLKEKPKRR